MTQVQSKTERLSSLPPVWPRDLLAPIRQAAAAAEKTLVVLDDDPTGTQTVYDLPVLTEWSAATLRAELARASPCFYLLTNARSLPAGDARVLNREAAANLRAASQATGRRFTVVSRSDSTLRGHFPLETDTLADLLGPFDATFLIPYFEAGGRYTIGDVHYVAEGDRLTPAAETPFAQDAAFGYVSSNLREWVQEKTEGRVQPGQVRSLSLERLREEGPEGVATWLRSMPTGAFCVVNACAPRDAEVFALASLLAEASGRRYLYRTAASFVSARLGLEPRPLLADPALGERSEMGGLIVVGSYVPKTSRQLERLSHRLHPDTIELDVSQLATADSARPVVESAIEEINHNLGAGRDVAVYTSRRLQVSSDAAASLASGRRISEALVEIVRRLAWRPRYLIAKGGITASDLASRALGVKRALVLGQILPGVPVWQLGEETKFPGLAYVVFPGNVGDDDALADAVCRLPQRRR
jgi:uncharacterized protein YgbK (DUF1537 family)